MAEAFTPTCEDEELLRQLAERLPLAGGQVEVRLGAGEEARHLSLSPLLMKLLWASVRELQAGHTVFVVASEEEVTPAEAARFLGISRPHLVNTLLHGGALPYRMEGTHHRIAMKDLVAYREERERRHAAADALSALSQDLDLYGLSREAGR